LEPNTYFHKFPPKLPEDDAIFQMQQSCQELLACHGYQQYEISAYAKHGTQCRHNRNYWQFGDYLGIGAGAHGKISLAMPDNIIRTLKAKHPEHYLQNPNSVQLDVIQQPQLPLEFVMNHLRLREGFNLKNFQLITGLSCASLEPGLSENIAANLLINEHQQIYCSKKGWDFLDVVLEKFLA
jgi:oxygen-independent coproporphyrinogen-3 oxidase